MTQAEELYSLYPRKVGKKHALKMIGKALVYVNQNAALWNEEHNGSFKLAGGFEWLRERVKMFAESPAGQHHGLFDGYHPPHPGTWFHDGRYEDDPQEWYVERKEDIERQKLWASQGLARPK